MKRESPKPSPTIYSAHRARQRSRILEAAEKQFAERGIDRVTMGELTVASGVQPSTMYQYFSSKDDIIWAIVGSIIQKATYKSRQNDVSNESGLNKITGFLSYMADELANRPAQVRFMAQFDAIYAREWPVERLLALEVEAGGLHRELFRRLIEEGIADGSLRSDLNPEVTLEAVINTAIGTQRRLASLDKKLELEFGQPVNLLFRETIRILLFGLRAAPAGGPEVPKKTKPKRLK